MIIKTIKVKQNATKKLLIIINIILSTNTVWAAYCDHGESYNSVTVITFLKSRPKATKHICNSQHIVITPPVIVITLYASTYLINIYSIRDSLEIEYSNSNTHTHAQILHTILIL